MLLLDSIINEKTKHKLIENTAPFFKERTKEIGLNAIISKILNDKDLFLYMANASIKDSGIMLGRMNYYDDIGVEVPYGITYNFENPSLNIFTFETCAFGIPKKPIESLKLLGYLPSEKSMGMETKENYSDYPTSEFFVNRLNEILQKSVKEQKPWWIDFNKSFYG